MMNAIRELLTPGGNETPYIRGVVGIGHAMVGAALTAFFGWYGLGAAAVLAVAYFFAKESGDIKRGGEPLDSLEDAVMVALGAWYGEPWWPALMLACGFYLMVLRK